MIRRNVVTGAGALRYAMPMRYCFVIAAAALITPHADAAPL